MKNRALVCGAAVLTLVSLAFTGRSEDYQLLRTKAELLVDQTKGFGDSCRSGSYVQNAAYQYYFRLVHAVGTNLLARSASPSNERLLRTYIDRVCKDYESYTRAEEAEGKALATGSVRGKAGSRHRAKRLLNAEKFRDRELSSAIARWEKFFTEIKSAKER